jgi:hypothetical protein
MGANAQTSVPTFVASQVLTAAQVNQINTGVPVFADSTARTNAFGGSGEKVLAQGQLSYLESDGKIYVYTGTAWVSISSVTNVAAFTASGTWTVPAGVTYAIAHIRGGGGGTARNSGAGAGGNSSVAFSGGTVTATGGNSATTVNGYQYLNVNVAGVANSGEGAWRSSQSDPGVNSGGQSTKAGNGAYVVAGNSVTPAASITVTVGAGGTAGTDGAAGGSGYVWIEYQV